MPSNIVFKKYKRYATVPNHLIPLLRKLSIRYNSELKWALDEKGGEYIVVAFSGNTPIGWCVMWRRWVSVFVAPAWRGRGIARRLLARFLRWEPTKYVIYFWPAQPAIEAAAVQIGYEGVLKKGRYY